jgi:hypothetical protein
VLVSLATSAAGLIFGVILIGLLLAAAVICAMKGKWVFFVIGWFSGIFWIIGASASPTPIGPDAVTRILSSRRRGDGSQGDLSLI